MSPRAFQVVINSTRATPCSPGHTLRELQLHVDVCPALQPWQILALPVPQSNAESHISGP